MAAVFLLRDFYLSSPKSIWQVGVGQNNMHIIRLRWGVVWPKLIQGIATGELQKDLYHYAGKGSIVILCKQGLCYYSEASTSTPYKLINLSL